MTARHGLTAFAVLLVAALAGVLAIESGAQAPRATASPAAPAPAGDEAAFTTIAAAPAEASREIVERPLFFASRRPLPPEPPAAVEARPEPEPPLNFALVGTIVTNVSRTALVKPEKLPSLELAAGQSLDGWTVSSIDVDRIMVRHGATVQLLGLRDFGAAKVLPASMRAPTAARPGAPGIPPTIPAGASQAAAAQAGAQPTGAPPGPSGAIRRQGGRR